MLVRFHVPESGLSVSWWSQNGYPCVSYPRSISCLWNVPEESIVLFLRITKKLEEPNVSPILNESFTATTESCQAALYANSPGSWQNWQKEDIWEVLCALSGFYSSYIVLYSPMTNLWLENGKAIL
jgi:hypothetical protein